MAYDDDAHEINRLIIEHVRSPSPRHIRDKDAVAALTRRIIEAVRRPPGLWTKWSALREDLIKTAALTWIPAEDLRSVLNSFPGPILTLTDVTQRLSAIHEEEGHWPDEAFRADCLELYRREREAGTEMIAIAGAIREFVEEATRQRREHLDREFKQRREAEKQALEARFLAGADCGWTPIRGSVDVFTRKNGRAYRLSPTRDRRWDMFRIDSAEDAGKRVGTYRTRGDASRALTQLAYQPEPRW
ncbi:MAG: hypothetical protein ACOVQ6_22225 [Brevundimonas sp.]